MSDSAAHDDEQIVSMLRQSIDRYGAEHYDFEHRRRALSSPLGHSAQAWSDYGRLGWLALRLPLESGGIAAGPRVIAPLMEAVGARLLLEPILASVIIGTGLVLRRAGGEQRDEMLPKLADGTLKLAFAHHESLSAHREERIGCRYDGAALHGAKIAVLHADCADRFVVSARNPGSEESVSLYLVAANAPGVRRECFKLLDGRGAANIHFDRTPAQSMAAPDAIGADAAAIAAALDEAAVASCCEAHGAIKALNAATIGYVKTRKQFGRAIGTNQALQHRLVEMYMLEQEVRALTLAALRSLGQPGAQYTRMIEGARAFVCGAARKVSAEAVQMHGGMGISDELNISHYYRRIMVLGTLYGNREFHLTRFAAACNAAAQ